MRRPLLLLALTLLAAACQPAGGSPTRTLLAPGSSEPADVGILVMAHGGGSEWDRAVAEALEPVRAAAPTAVAFGMADPRTVEAGLDSLEALGVRRVAVVRLFLSGRSFRAETLALLGLEEPVTGHHGDVLSPIDHGLQIATHDQGVLDSPLAVEVLVERALSAGGPASHQSVLLAAHGMDDDEDDAAVLHAIDGAASVLGPEGFARVEGVTLREDWPEKRVEAEARMRDFVSEETRAGRSVLVIPVRLFDFGPYADVLRGFEYDHTPALLPHPLIARWILDTADAIACREGWPAVTTPCPA